MAFNKQTFYTRTITAIIFAIIMLFGLVWNLWSFLLLTIAICSFCWWELLALMEKIEKIKFSKSTKTGFLFFNFGLLLSVCGKAFYMYDEPILFYISLPVFVVGIILLLQGYFSFHFNKIKFLKTFALGVVYITLSCGLFLHLRQQNLVFKDDNLFLDLGRALPLFIIFSLWINDTMAYIIGSMIGKTPLHYISPKKTWEGFIGGGVLACVIMFLIGKYIFDLPNIFSIILPIIIVIVGTTGDLFESKLKRMADVKDSGTILPGHGGFLDRFDSLLFSVPFVWAFVMLF